MHGSDDPYLEFLRARADRLFHCLQYPGNAGDALIQFATQRILRDLDVATTTDPASAQLILVPGGNPTMWTSVGPQRWRALWMEHKQAEFVVGPAGFHEGYSNWAQIVNKDGLPVTGLFARDPVSYRNLCAANLRSGITFGLSHDPALYLRGSEWLNAHRQEASDEFDLVAFRDDHETNLGHFGIWHASGAVLPNRVHQFFVRKRAAVVRSRKIKLAAAQSRLDGSPPILNRDISHESLDVFMKTLRAARVVHTDRLHVMIVAALLGKKTFAYPTAQGKLEGVYHHSLADWADVTFVRM